MFNFFRMGLPGPMFSEFEKFRQLVLLWSVEQSSNRDGRGITGYELKTLFNVPQTTVYRALGDLETRKLVRVDETIVDGRAQKRYTLTPEGRLALDGLKKTVAGKITFLFEMLATDIACTGSGHIADHIIAMFTNRIKSANSKEDALALLETFQEMHVQQVTMLKNALDKMNEYQDKLCEIKRSVENMDKYGKDSIMSLLEKNLQDVRDENE